MPEMEMHARGEDREDDELETVHGCLLVGIQSRIGRCVLLEHAVVPVLCVRNINGFSHGALGNRVLGGLAT